LKDVRKELIRFGEILTLRISCSEFEKGETTKLDTDLENFEKQSGNLFPWLTIGIGSSLTVIVFALLTILCFLIRRLNQAKKNQFEMEKHWQADEWPEPENIQRQEPEDLPGV
jgi:flagellar biosynthesis/type III secretory pathway M-ring protein FliF/YscJ